MHQPENQQIKIGPKGSILESQDNQQLLDQLKTTSALSPMDLLKLARLYKGDPANGALATHLALFAIGLISLDVRTDKDSSQSSTASVHSLANETKVFNEAADQIEDFIFGKIDAEDRKTAGPIPPPRFSDQTPQIQWVSYSGVGLLIETRPPDNLHYIIGVGPDPASLPNE